ncbi:hypothetical protein N9242_05615, partial [Vicingaceae bacterium]|nr:hypothetical protein [Vicingaceae bacterium]
VKKALQPAKRVDSLNESVHFAEDWTDLEQQTSEPLVLIVDQLEECFTRPNPELPQELDEFLNEIQAILGRSGDRPQGRLILGFRKEWLAEIESRLQDRRLPRTKVFLERLGRLGIIEAILGPTKSKRLQEQYGLRVEEGLAETIADDLLRDPGSAIAPTLQILLTKMWSKATEENQSHPGFDRELYLRLKREGILLNDFLDQQFDQIREWRPDVVESGLALDVLSLHTTQMGTAAKQDAYELPESYPHRADVLEPLVQKCKDLYLLVDPSQDRGSGEKGTRLSHDTLAPLIRARYDDSDKPGQRARRILDNRAVDWEDDKEGAPLDPLDLRVVEQGTAGSRALSDTEERLLHASRVERDKRIRLQWLLRIGAGVAIVIIAGLAVRLLMIEIKTQKTKNENQQRMANTVSEVIDDYFTTIATNDNEWDMLQMREKLLQQAATHYEKFVVDFELTDNEDLQRGVAVAQYNLGRVHFIKGESQIASEQFQKAQEIQKNLYEKSLTNNDDLTDLQIALEYSNTLTEIGRAKKDRNAYDSALTIRKKIADSVEKDNVNWSEYQRKLANAHMNYTNFFEQDFASAEANHNAAQSIRTSAVQEFGPDDQRADPLRRDIGKGHVSLKILYEQKALNPELNDESFVKYRDLLIENCNDAIDEFKLVLTKQSNDWEVLDHLADCYLSLGIFLPANNDIKLEKFNESRKKMKEIVDANPRIPQYKKNLAKVFINWPEYDANQRGIYLAEAKKILASVRKKYPDDVEAQELFETTENKIKQL